LRLGLYFHIQDVFLDLKDHEWFIMRECDRRIAPRYGLADSLANSNIEGRNKVDILILIGSFVHAADAIADSEVEQLNSLIHKAREARQTKWECGNLEVVNYESVLDGLY